MPLMIPKAIMFKEEYCSVHRYIGGQAEEHTKKGTHHAITGGQESSRENRVTLAHDVSYTLLRWIQMDFCIEQGVSGALGG